MKTLAIACLSLVMLAGCQTPVRDIEIKEVKVPIYIFPKPPVLPTTQSKVSNLVEADKGDPGKVAQAYKHDHMVMSEQLHELTNFVKHLNDLHVSQSVNIGTVE